MTPMVARRDTLARLTAAGVVSVMLPFGLAACGAGGSKTGIAKAAPAVTTTTTSAQAARRTVEASNPRVTTRKRHAAHAHPKTTTHAKLPSAPAPKPPAPKPPAPAATHPAKRAPAKSKAGGSSSSSSAGAQPVQPLPSPVVSGSSGGMHATIHGENHAPTVNKNWSYSVLATDAGGRPLTGTVETEFVFSGQVVGRETPATHRLRNGRLNDGLTFPAEAVGEPISVQVVVHTPLGSVTLDWAIRVRR
jgi:hypothetical protein